MLLQASFSDSVVVKCGSTTLLRFVFHSELLAKFKEGFKSDINIQIHQKDPLRFEDCLIWNLNLVYPRK